MFMTNFPYLDGDNFAHLLTESLFKKEKKKYLE